MSLRKGLVGYAVGVSVALASGAQEAPGIYFHNEEYPHTSGGRPAGMYFMNDEGTEAGGIIFSGNKKKDGRPFSLVQFSMDNYDQDQALVLRHIQDRGIETALIVNDVPLVPKERAPRKRPPEDADLPGARSHTMRME